MQVKRWLIFSLVFFLPFIVKAETEELEKVAETVKYYKTVIILSNSEVMRSANLGEVSSITTEITEEEYNNVDTSTVNNDNARGLISETIETTYKKLATTMYYNYGDYRYRATLDWKLIPSTRSYDIIGIGHYATVKLLGNIDFNQIYCRSSSECYDSTSYIGLSFTNGGAAIFKIPSGTVKSLKQILEFDVEKTNSSATITQQLAVGDYAHATSSISETNARKFYVDCGGINLQSSIEDYYDDIATADATWTGTW